MHLGLYHDETAELCQWHVPEAHFLESWGDVRAFDGTVSLDSAARRAALRRTHGARSRRGDERRDRRRRDGSGEGLLDARVRRTDDAGLDASATRRHGVSRTPRRSGGTRCTTGSSRAPACFRRSRRRHPRSRGQVRRGRRRDSRAASLDSLTTPPAAGAAGARPAAAIAPAGAAAPAAIQATGMEIIFRPDPNVLDGRFANNGWLQELPKPLSKVTWDNVAYISPKTAEFFSIPIARVGNRANDVVEIRYQGRTARLPVWVLPGTADDMVVVHFGYGRRRAGRVGTGIGVDTFGLRTSKAPWFDGGAEIVQDRRDVFHRVDAEPFRDGRPPSGARRQRRGLPEGSEGRRGARARNPAADDVALSAVHVCGPQVGHGDRSQRLHRLRRVRRGVRRREQHPGRRQGRRSAAAARCTGCASTPTSKGDPATPEGTYNQPVPCMQCENAPCESVCPVAATVHSDEGLNDMVYNRCVGTRYCSNNCPYKVRRFNFLLYSDFHTPELMAQRNPDVTIRSRGVMEKCTYCVQRINHARIDAKTEGRADQGRRDQDGVRAGVPGRRDRLRRSERRDEPRGRSSRRRSATTGCSRISARGRARRIWRW